MTRLTALQALRNIRDSAQWFSDDLAQDAAVEALVLDGYDHQAAVRAVKAAFANNFAIMGAV